jgi:hypothetical protein
MVHHPGRLEDYVTDDELKALEAAAKAAIEMAAAVPPLGVGTPAETFHALRDRRVTLEAYQDATPPGVILRLTAELRKARETIAAHHSGESVTAREFMATLDKDEELRKAREKWAQYERDAIHEAHEAATLRARVAELEAPHAKDCAFLCNGREPGRWDCDCDASHVKRLEDRVGQLEGDLRWIEMDTRDPSAPNERSNKRARAALAAGKNGRTTNENGS